MVQSDLSEYKPLFMQTAWDYMRQLESGLTVLKDSGDTSVIEMLHISAHSLKSQSLVMGFPSFGATSYELEKIFKQLKDNAAPLSHDDIIKLQGVVASMSIVLSQISSEDIDSPMDGEIHILQEIQQKRGGTV